VLSSVQRDNIYWFGARGFLFTSPWVVTPTTVRHPAVLLLTASGEPVELTLGGRVVRHDALAIAPLTRRGLRAADVGLVSVNIEVHHPCFRAFRSIAGAGVLGLDRKVFAHFDAALVGAYQGWLSQGEAQQLFEGLVRTAERQIPGPRRHDPRAELLHEILRENPACSLGNLARELRLSYTGASHLFTRTIGLPLRSYQQSAKRLRAAERLHEDVSLTQIAHQAGFTDLAHLSRAHQRHYGLPPSYIRDARHVRLFL
jgi:AraC-like DNA-binding protein